MALATLVDVDALWHVGVYSLLGTVGLTGSYGTLVLSLDRARTARGWWLVAGLAAVVCLAILALGLWAMTKK